MIVLIFQIMLGVAQLILFVRAAYMGDIVTLLLSAFWLGTVHNYSIRNAFARTRS